MDKSKFDDLKTLLEHERVMLQNWQEGDLSLLPDGWSIEKQIGYICGLRHVLAELEII